MLLAGCFGFVMVFRQGKRPFQVSSWTWVLVSIGIVTLGFGILVYRGAFSGKNGPLEFQSRLSPEYLRTLSPRPENMAAIFDHAYVLTTEKCEFRADLIQKRASKHGIILERIYGIPSENFTLDDPPIPIMGMPVNDTVTTGQVGVAEAHMRIWKDAWAKGYNTTLIVEDDVFPSEEISSHLPDIFQMIQGAAIVHERPWSVIVFRRSPLQQVQNEAVWSPLLDGQNVTVAAPSWWAAAYIVSRSGLRFLLDHVTHYSHPIDVEMSKLQANYSDFVVLSLCRNGDSDDVYKNCPSSATELTTEEKAQCSHSGSQQGQRWPGSRFPDPKG